MAPKTGTSSDRAGRSVRQPGGYRAFLPRPLPPDPPVQHDEALLALLSDADRELARLSPCTARATPRDHRSSAI
jgi:hypothetical protein